MNTQFFKKQVVKLPVYWKLATVRCAIYAMTGGWATFKAGTTGFDRLSDLTPLQHIWLCGDVLTAMLIVWVAFLDQTMTKLSDGKSEKETESIPINTENQTTQNK